MDLPDWLLVTKFPEFTIIDVKLISLAFASVLPPRNELTEAVIAILENGVYSLFSFLMFEKVNTSFVATTS